MIGNKLEQSIIEIFQSDIDSTFSINQISKLLKKSYPIINKKLNFLISEGIITKTNIGRSYQCFLNTNNEKTRILMSINELNKREIAIQKNSFIGNNVDEIVQLSKQFSLVTSLINKNNLIIVLSDLEQKKAILEKTTLTKDYILSFFDSDSFKKKFLSDKELQKYHLLLFNTEIYVNLISPLVLELVSKKMLSGSETNKTAKKLEKNKIV